MTHRAPGRTASDAGLETGGAFTAQRRTESTHPARTSPLVKGGGLRYPAR
ncbi:hypothetical protein [Roseovarius sp. MMSF_3281]|nr:hypothetical protein [Roseovarius sp. MMSF_3281]